MEQPNYVLTNLKSIGKYDPHFKLQKKEYTSGDVVCFDVVSGWYGSEIEKSSTVLVVIEAEEFEAVKNFLTTIRS
jgi:hypothetical protein